MNCNKHVAQVVLELIVFLSYWNTPTVCKDNHLCVDKFSGLPFNDVTSLGHWRSHNVTANCSEIVVMNTQHKCLLSWFGFLFHTSVEKTQVFSRAILFTNSLLGLIESELEVIFIYCCLDCPSYPAHMNVTTWTV